ncbi:pupal cuticle protein Edg-78E-like [Condylostylus longicornis]|uniref:pupal cuticle protein Edg-78E-like n=1 Tax=Condylostylus longicornis TaxID=2530218 RepID=UPI00244E5408|nr:pupal cuticle protein Edg-78E-like [Condylostylus longicornis]
MDIVLIPETYYIALTVLLGLVTADHINKNAEVKSLVNNVPGDGTYAYSFDSTNGISIQESGNADTKSGSAGWVSPEGEKVQLTYTADENGYHPQGSHIPVPPEIPAHILRALEYIRTHPSAV